MNKADIIYLDIPWGEGIYGKRTNTKTRFGGGAESHYPTMNKQEILDFKYEIDEVSNSDSMILMWVTGPSMAFALEVMKHYGYEYKTIGFSWIKVSKAGNPRILPSYYFGANCELVLIGIKGKNKGKFKPEQKLVGQVVMSELRQHSRKPDEIYEKIERTYPSLSKCEFFSRTSRDGWIQFGNQTGKFNTT